jgi:uncharacterized damage-inducible protein DinB
MTLIESFRRELENESVATRKMLARIPADKYEFQPHEKSMDLQRLANHIADLPYWIRMSLHLNELDFAKNPYKPTTYQGENLMHYFEEGLKDALASFDEANDDMLPDSWILRDGDTIFVDSNKHDTVRMSISQIIHHRAQLGVYLRLLNVPIPGSYGPSADGE